MLGCGGVLGFYDVIIQCILEKSNKGVQYGFNSNFMQLFYSVNLYVLPALGCPTRQLAAVPV